MPKSWMIAILAGMAVAVAAAETGVARFRLGDTELIALQDAAAGMENAIFRGADEAELQRLAPSGRSEASVNAFLLRRRDGAILVDAGNGGLRGNLNARLAQIGVQPEEIDFILLTHMHFDHIGGLASADGRAVFPRAILHVSKPELDYWSSPAAGAAGERAMKILAAYGDRVKSFPFEAEILPGLRGLAAAGHTPGHTVYELHSLLILGDLVHAAALQFPNPAICATYDQNMSQAVAARRMFYEKAAATGKTVAGMHLPFPGVGKVNRDANGNYRFIPEQPSAD